MDFLILLVLWGGGGAENSKWVSEVVPSKLQEGSGHTVASGEMVGVKKF